MKKMCSLYALWKHISFSQNLTEILCMSQKDAEMPQIYRDGSHFQVGMSVKGGISSMTLKGRLSG